jgi:16S rRNA (uracil1498-N3)-methyltransferase
MDLVIQKTVELGVKEIIPVITERSQVRETRKLLRWQKIAEEASRQSGRSIIPVIHDALAFDKVFLSVPDLQRKGIVFWETGGEELKSVFESMKDGINIDIFTGPEGGLSEHEVQSSLNNGFVAATLGKRILRAETAAISAVSLVQYVLGDLGTLTA